MVDPKYFSFMSVDAEGFNQYNHCLIFYERFTETLIQADFDETAYIERLARNLERANFKAENNKFLAEFGKAGERLRAKRRREMVDDVIYAGTQFAKDREQQAEESKLQKDMPKEVL